MKLSIVILTFNSEKYLNEVLSSSSFADEIIILDSGSSDETKNISSKYNTKFIYQKWLGFGKQKQFGVNISKNEWVFVLDSDEIIPKNLEEEIKNILNSPNFMAYKIPRLNYFFGKPIKKMGLYPDYTVRLFNKNKASFTQDEVHERIETNEKIGFAKNPMRHYAYENIEQFIQKQNRYSTLNKKGNKFKAILNPPWTFFRLYFLKLGFLEGWRGFVIAKLYSQYTFWKYIKN